MLNLLILAISSTIIIRDFKLHRIANTHLAFLALILLFDMHRTSFTTTLISIAATIALFTVAKIGMGDIKLAVAMIATQGSIVLTRDFFDLSLLALLLTALLRLLKYRDLRGSVAFAHVLLLPFLALYLAI